jgi:uncharacterized membrane protein YbaN (DUF454 family)
MVVPYKKIARFTIALILFIIGLLGLILPVVNGTLFIMASLLILSLEIPALEKFLDRQGRRNSTVNHYYEKCKRFIEKYL